MHPQLVCAVDIGTSAVRAGLIDSLGTVHRLAYRQRQSAQGTVTFDAQQLWGDVAEALADLHIETADKVVALAVAGHVGTVLLDEEGLPVGPGRGWADTTGVDELSARWSNDGPELRSVRRPAVTGGALPLLTWMKEHSPHLLDRVRWVLSPKDYLLHQLGATGWTDATTAAYTLALDVEAVAWSSELIKESGVAARSWPRIAAATELVGQVGADAARRTGLPVGLPIAAGGPDGTVGAAAVLGKQRGLVADVAGTTDVLTTLSADVRSEAGDSAVTNPYVESGTWSRGGATGMTGGAVTAWSKILGFGSVADIPAEIATSMTQLPAGCDGLSALPTMTGSRFPDWRQSDHGALWGLSERHGPEHIMRATQEAGAFVVREGVDLLVDRTAGQLLLAGGVARSAILAQLRADALGMSVLASQIADVSLLGAAIIGQVAGGSHDDTASAQQVMGPQTRRFEPHAERAQQYDEIYEAWLSARKRIRE